MGTGVSFPRAKRQGREAYHSPPFSIPSLPLYVFMVVLRGTSSALALSVIHRIDLKFVTSMKLIQKNVDWRLATVECCHQLHYGMCVQGKMGKKLHFRIILIIPALTNTVTETYFFKFLLKMLACRHFTPCYWWAISEIIIIVFDLIMNSFPYRWHHKFLQGRVFVNFSSSQISAYI
jgi:hypothetical protein